ncbi:MAG TPA: DUF2130 domain-containing protein [Candidatus Woesebacteria bacterium]|nr:DUF2130 domain-containing protein [Candidatus Woesebacteria bacterium]
MSDSIICPHCKKQIQLTEALTHEIDEKYKLQLDEERKKAEEERLRLIELSKKRIEEEKNKTAKEVENVMRKKIVEEMELKLKDTQNESEELKKEKRLMQEQLLELNKTMRKLQDQNREKELELTKKFNEEQDKLRKEEQQKVEEQFKLKLLEQDKKLQDVLKANEDLKRKLEQGSQQMQGEVLELAVEELLQREFPFDEVKPVPKGITGADIIQTVNAVPGKQCGTIIWEMKRTKAWSHQWVEKLKSDQRQVKAELAVIISQVVPDGIKRFGVVDGVWVCEFDCITGMAYALRNQLIDLHSAKSSMVGQKDKMNVLYSYITSTEFRHRVEAIIEAFSNMQEEIEKERRWFAQKWSREEKNLRKVLDNTLGMHGDLQSIMGKSIAELKSMEQLPEQIDQATDGKLF